MSHARLRIEDRLSASMERAANGPMLPMIPLDADEARAARVDPTATSFFALPAPARARIDPPRPAPVPRVVPAAPARFVPAAPFPAPSLSPPLSPALSDDARIQSFRVVAVLVFVFGLACLALAATIVITAPRTRALLFPPPPIAVHDEGDVWVAPLEDEDEVGNEVEDEVEDEVEVVPAPRPAPHRPPPVARSGTVDVRFSGDLAPQLVEVRCGTFRARAGLSGGAASIPDVPRGEPCQLFPKGGVVSTPARVEAGRTYACTIVGTTTSCTS